jgi:RNA polymerase sigma-70 factor (ECF subfamily)
VDTERAPWVEPELSTALAALPEQQRVVVMLLHCFEWSMSEVAELLQVSKSTVQTHAERGMAQLRERMGVTL